MPLPRRPMSARAPEPTNAQKPAPLALGTPTDQDKEYRAAKDRLNALGRYKMTDDEMAEYTELSKLVTDYEEAERAFEAFVNGARSK